MTLAGDVPLVNKLNELAHTTDDSSLRAALESLSQAVSVGNITGSTGVAIGRNIRMVINQLHLPSEMVAEILALRQNLGGSVGLNADQYKLKQVMVDKTQDFVGRAYVFDAIRKFVETRPNGYFIIKGDPGIGKSAWLAEYVRRTGCIVHFNDRNLGVTTSRQFLHNVCTQLIVDNGLPYLDLPLQALQDGAFLLDLLKKIAEDRPSNEPLVIAVDALDEVDVSNRLTGNILNLPSTLPRGIFFVVTQRRQDIPLVAQVPQDVLDMTDYSPENRRDIEVYLKAVVQRPGIQTWLAQQTLSATDFVSALAALSENNFMYLRYVLPELESGIYRQFSVEKLPIGLEGYYQQHWELMGMTARPAPRAKLRIVYVMGEIGEPVSRSLLVQLANDQTTPIDALAVQEVLDEWKQFLHEIPTPTGNRYSIYHSSFRDFLHRKAEISGIRIKDIHALIQEVGWRDWFDDSA